MSEFKFSKKTLLHKNKIPTKNTPTKQLHALDLYKSIFGKKNKKACPKNGQAYN